jgi:hypothetical protein
MGFDHVPMMKGQPAPPVPGIFVIVGDTLTVCFLPPSPTRRRPTDFQSTPVNGAMLMTFTRVNP